MINSAEFNAYKEWVAMKLADQVDLSIEAYNAELSKLALAWDAGALWGINPGDRQKIASAVEANPYRNGTVSETSTNRITS